VESSNSNIWVEDGAEAEAQKEEEEVADAHADIKLLKISLY